MFFFLNLGIGQEWFGWESRVSRSIHDELQCQLLDNLSNGFRFTADIRTNLFIPLALYTIGEEKECQAAKLATTSLVLSTATVFGLKSTINRQRPSGDFPRWDSSFPSGHTATAFATSVIYAHHYPKLTIPLLLYSSLVGFSRVYTEEHYPTDVLAGMALGAGISYLVLKFKKEILSLL